MIRQLFAFARFQFDKLNVLQYLHDAKRSFYAVLNEGERQLLPTKATKWYMLKLPVRITVVPVCTFNAVFVLKSHTYSFAVHCFGAYQVLYHI